MWLLLPGKMIEQGEEEGRKVNDLYVKRTNTFRGYVHVCRQQKEIATGKNAEEEHNEEKSKVLMFPLGVLKTL